MLQIVLFAVLGVFPMTVVDGFAQSGKFVAGVFGNVLEPGSGLVHGGLDLEGLIGQIQMHDTGTESHLLLVQYIAGLFLHAFDSPVDFLFDLIQVLCIAGRKFLPPRSLPRCLRRNCCLSFALLISGKTDPLDG